MAATQTQAETDTQSVYIADKDQIVNYPRSMDNGQINYDIQTRVRGKSPEDYQINFLPLTEVQQAWKAIEINAPALLDSVSKTPPAQVAQGIGSALKAESDYVDPAMKLIVSDPAYALGFTKDENNPESVANTYKPWLELWRDSTVGKKLTDISDEALANKPFPVAAVPWFFTEFAPDQLLQFGTKASNWVGAYGVEKFGPPILNAVISKLPDPVREVLLKDIFSSEASLAPDFETLGIKVNSKTSQVHDAYIKASKIAHPDAGGTQEEFIALNQAYQKIMQSRSSWYDKLFDLFRGSQEFQQRAAAGGSEPRGVVGLLTNEKGSAMIPFSQGDLVRVGEQTGSVIKATGKIVTVNVAGKIIKAALNDVTPINTKPGPDTAVNLDKLQVADEAKIKITEATKELKDKIENQTGKVLSNEEVIQAAKEADLLTQGVSREATLQFEASLLKTRQHLAALAEQNELTPEFLDTLRIVANTGTDIARSLQSFNIDAMPEYAETKVKVIKDLLKLGKSSEEILNAAKGVDFNDEQSVARFYRQFVKPKLSEMLDEYVYMNILSSPITHIVNAFSNALQLSVLNPLTRLASGSIDAVLSRLRGVERVHYVSEVPAFYKGVMNAVPKAFDAALQAMKGKKNLERPDVKHLPTLSKRVDWGTFGIGKYVLRALEASDVFFRTMIEAGEVEALSKRLGHTPNEKELAKIVKQAKENANYYVFRKRPDQENATGQGHLLSVIDNFTNAIYRLRRVPGVKWFVRFVQTPMNILKQGIEYSPAGFATIPGAKDKTEQAAKAAIGTLVFSGALWLAHEGLTTWSAPTSENEKEAFYAAGLQPYSVRIGDTWVSYSKIGPLAYPLAMAAALHYFTKESPNALSDSEMDKVVDAMTGLMKFFSDQSYMQGLGDLVSFAQGEKTKAITSAPTQLVSLSSLQGWVNNIIDPLQRKAAKGLSIESAVDQIQMKIIGMSQMVPAEVDSEEVQAKKQMRGVNAVSPLKMSKVEPGKLSEYRDSQQTKQEENLMEKEMS